MEFGVAIAIFLLLATLVVLLFYFITRCRHRQLKMDMNEGINNHLYSHSDHNIQEQCYQYLELQRQRGVERNQPYEIQLNKIGIPQNTFRSHSMADIINNSLIPLKQEKIHMKSSLKALVIQPLQSTKMVNNRLSIPQQQVQTHIYLNRLVGYEQGKITIIQIFMKNIKKDEKGRIIENKKIKKNEFRIQDQGERQFKISLQAFNLQQFQYGGFKFMNKIQVNNMTINEPYELKHFKISQFKEWIQVDQFKKLGEKLLR